MRRLLRWIRERRSNLFELAGFGLLTAAAFQIDLTLGLAAAGVACLNFAFGRRPRSER